MTGPAETPNGKPGETTTSKPTSTPEPVQFPTFGLNLFGADAGMSAVTLPYVEFSHAMRRANRDFWAVTKANRVLADALRQMLRRQQELAFELAETAARGNLAPGSASANELFDSAADAVRELGQSMIDAQLTALRMLEVEALPPEGVKPPKAASR
jgi:hypothetical protein